MPSAQPVKKEKPLRPKTSIKLLVICLGTTRYREPAKSTNGLAKEKLINLPEYGTLNPNIIYPQKKYFLKPFRENRNIFKCQVICEIFLKYLILTANRLLFKKSTIKKDLWKVNLFKGKLPVNKNRHTICKNKLLLIVFLLAWKK